MRLASGLFVLALAGAGCTAKAAPPPPAPSPARAAYNTAYSYGRFGTAAKGIPFAERAAAAHKDIETLATELLEILRKAG